MRYIILISRRNNVVGNHEKCLTQELLMCTTTCFLREIRKNRKRSILGQVNLGLICEFWLFTCPWVCKKLTSIALYLFLGQIKKCVFRVTLPYLIFLMKPSNFLRFLKKKSAKHSDEKDWANSVDPDQTAPKGAVWSGSTLFAILSVLLETFKEKIKQTW